MDKKGRLPMRGILVAALLVVGLPALPAGADTIVSSDAELVSAVAASNGGTIALAPGSYDDVTISGKTPSTPLVITSTDPANPAVIDGWVMINNSSNITLTGLEVDPASIAAFDGWHQAVLIRDSSDVIVRDIVIDGHIVTAEEGVDPSTIRPGDPNRGDIVGYRYGTGLAVRFSNDVLVEDVEIRDLHSGGFLQNSEAVTVRNAYIHDMRSEGLDLEDLRDVVIEDSRFERFHPWRNTDGYDSDHPDMIQFWGANGEYGIQDLTIRNNVFLEPDGWTQTIFGGLSGGDADVVSFERFFIYDNLIVNAHLHGISLTNVMNSEIHHNLLLPGPGWIEDNSSVSVPQIFLRQDSLPASAGNSIYSNVVVAPYGQDTQQEYFGATYATNDIGDNTILGNRGYPDFFLDVFPNLHDAYAELPDLAVSSAYADVVGPGHGPRWLNLSGVRFVDSYKSQFYDDILWMDAEGITAGCDIDRYCPADPVTRGQVAASFSRALGLPSAGSAGFVDAADSQFVDDINRLAAAGITRGCDTDRYCPGQFVTRAQMAAFFHRASSLPQWPTRR